MRSVSELMKPRLKFGTILNASRWLCASRINSRACKRRISVAATRKKRGSDKEKKKWKGQFD